MLDLYIHAAPVRHEDGEDATLCVLVFKDRTSRTDLEEAPASRNELEAKYFALESGLRRLGKRRSSGPRRVFTDCWMLINQLQGRYEVKDSGFLKHRETVEGLVRDLGEVDIRYIPQQENLARKARE